MADEKIKNLVQMAVDAHNGTPARYSVDETQKILRNAIFNNAPEGLDLYRIGRDYGINYALIEEIIDTTTNQKVLEANNPLLQHIEWRNVSLGDRPVFKIKNHDNEHFYVSNIARGTQGLRRQRMTGAEQVTVSTERYGIKVYEELDRINTGASDINTFIDIASNSFARMRVDAAYGATMAVFNGITDPKETQSGTFDEEKLLNMITYLEAKTGLKASLMCTPQTARKITGLRGDTSEAANSQLFSMGYYDSFYNYPLYIIDNILDANDDFMLPTDIYVLLGEQKFLKGVNEDGTLIVPTSSPLANADFSTEWMMAQSFGIKAVVSTHMGVYHLS